MFSRGATADALTAEYIYFLFLFLFIEYVGYLAFISQQERSREKADDMPLDRNTSCHGYML